MVSSHTGLRNQLWIFRLRTLQEKQYRDTVASPPTHQQTKIVTVQKWQYRGTASTNTPTQTETLPAETNDPRMFNVPTRMPVPKQLGEQ